MKILIIEDENSLADIISSKLNSEKYDTYICNDGLDGYYNACSNNYDLIILDVMLPNMNGIEILKRLREKNIDCKIIMLTAKSSIEDKLDGLCNGANDYITKPFHIDELLARVNIQLKDPSKIKKSNVCEFGDIELDMSTSKLKCKYTNESVELVCKELKILEYFINNSELILSKEQIYDRVWGIDNESESNNLEAYLSFIRKKLKAIGSNIKIKAVRGLGYKLEK